MQEYLFLFYVVTQIVFSLKQPHMERGAPHGVVANVLDCDIVVSKFEFHLCYYIHFWTNTLGKGMNLFNLLLIFG